MQELLYGGAAFWLWIIPAALTMFVSRRMFKIPDELFRKILHFILLIAYIPVVFAFETWWIAAGFVAAMIVLLYPLLALAEKLPAFAAFINERREGEIKNSMVLALTIMVISICACWGGFGDKYLVLACVYAWGVGDAFAALFGKKFGKHKIRMKFADPHKSVEGSAAMFVTSATAVFAVMMLRGGLGAAECLVIAACAAAVSTFMELCTKNGYDTFTCPAVAMIVILPLINIMGG